jgi:hypothetical protein
MNSKGNTTVPSTQYPHVSWHLLTLLFITTHAIHHTFLHRTVFASFAHYSPSAQPEQGESRIRASHCACLIDTPLHT